MRLRFSILAEKYKIRKWDSNWTNKKTTKGVRTSIGLDKKLLKSLVLWKWKTCAHGSSISFWRKVPRINSRTGLTTNFSIIAPRNRILPDYGSEDAFWFCQIGWSIFHTRGSYTASLPYESSCAPLDEPSAWSPFHKSGSGRAFLQCGYAGAPEVCQRSCSISHILHSGKVFLVCALVRVRVGGQCD